MPTDPQMSVPLFPTLPGNGNGHLTAAPTPPSVPPGMPPKKSVPVPGMGWERRNGHFWPPEVGWARELGWLRVRDPWGKWHEILARDAPSGYVRLAREARRR